MIRTGSDVACALVMAVVTSMQRHGQRVPHPRRRVHDSEPCKSTADCSEGACGAGLQEGPDAKLPKVAFAGREEASCV